MSHTQVREDHRQHTKVREDNVTHTGEGDPMAIYTRVPLTTSAGASGQLVVIGQALFYTFPHI